MKKLIKCIVKLILLVVVLVTISVVWQGYQMNGRALRDQPLAEKVQEIREQPGYTPLSQLPETYKNAVIAAEDHRFRSHPGIDVIAIGRATVNNIQKMSLSEGGSTITQQLAKNLYFTQEKTFVRKAAETFLAFKLERDYTKDEILELYVNTIYFGDGYYGIRAASEGYFGKEPDQLSDYECTMLAGLPNAPSAYALTDHPELAEQRQQIVLNQMVKYQYLTQTEADQILLDENN